MTRTHCCSTPNKKGFVFDLILSSALVILGTFTIGAPWRSITFTGGADICPNYQLDLFNGMCESASFGKSSGCISWNDAGTWYSFDTINSEMNNNTKLQKDASDVWPLVSGMVAAGFGFLCLSFFSMISGLEECASGTVAQTSGGLFQLAATIMYTVAFVMLWRTDQLVGSAYQFCLADTILSQSAPGGIAASVIIFLGAVTTLLVIFPGLCGKYACVEEVEDDEIEPLTGKILDKDKAGEEKRAPLDL